MKGELTQNQQNIMQALASKAMTRAEMRGLGLNPRRLDLRKLERLGLIKSKEKYEYNSTKNNGLTKTTSGTRYFEYSLNK